MSKDVSKYPGNSYRVVSILLLVLFFNLSCSESHKTYRVGILSALDLFIETADGFKEEMSSLGYSEGVDIIYDFHSTNFEPEKELQILKQFVEDKVDLIVTFPSEVSLVAKKVAEGTGIPVVFANANVEGMNLIDSISVPGGNITGVRFPGPDITVKRLEILMELLPEAKSFLVAYQEGYPIVIDQLNALDVKAEEEGITLIKLGARDTSELRIKLDNLLEENENLPDAVLVIAEPLIANKRGFPIMGKFAEKLGVVMGGGELTFDGFRSLFSVSTNNKDVGRQAALLAHKIFNGTPAGTIPVVSAENYLVFDLKAAEHYGVEISNGLLKEANEISK